MRITILVMTAFLMAAPLKAQQTITLAEALRKARTDYPALRASRLQAGSLKAMQHTASPLGDLELSTGGEEIGRGNDAITTLVAARQNLDLFTVKSRRRRMKQETQVAEAGTRLMERQLQWQLSLDYAADVAARLRLEQYRQQARLYTDFVAAAKLRYDTQAAPLLEYQAAQSQQRQVELSLIEAEKDLNKAHINLSRWLGADTLYQAAGDIAETVETSSDTLSLHPALGLAEERVRLAEAVAGETRSAALPKFYVEMGSQKIGSRTGYWSWQVGLSLPVSFGANRARNRAAAIDTEKARADLMAEQRTIGTQRRTLDSEYAKWRSTVDYYRTSALPLAKEQRRIALLSYKEGATGYLDFIQAVKTAMDTELSYVDAYEKLLESKFNIEYYKNK
jgi:cobalt-zinc-cadmium resistance protein CzcA